MSENIKYRNQVIIAYHLAFNSIECRLSFLEGNRLHKEYMLHVFPFIINMLKDVDLKEVAEPAMKHMMDVIAQYAEKLGGFYPKHSPEHRELMRIADSKSKRAADPGSVLRYAMEVAEIDNLRNDCKYSSFDLENEFPYWPADMQGKLGLLDAAYIDYNAVMNGYSQIVAAFPGDASRIRKPAIATSIQFMVGPRDFMSHIGVAFQHGLRREKSKNDPKLVLKNMKNAENHLHRLIFDFTKITTLMAFHSEQFSKKPGINLQQILHLLEARHYEHCMIGKGFLERYVRFREVMIDIVSTVMPDIALSKVEIEEM